MEEQAAQMVTLKVGGVPEHFNYPWHMAIERKIFEKHGVHVEWVEQKLGTGIQTSIPATARLQSLSNFSLFYFIYFLFFMVSFFCGFLFYFYFYLFSLSFGSRPRVTAYLDTPLLPFLSFLHKRFVSVNLNTPTHPFTLSLPFSPKPKVP